jgi:hypothetical protein
VDWLREIVNCFCNVGIIDINASNNNNYDGNITISDSDVYQSNSNSLSQDSSNDATSDSNTRMVLKTVLDRNLYGKVSYAINQLSLSEDLLEQHIHRNPTFLNEITKDKHNSREISKNATSSTNNSSSSISKKKAASSIGNNESCSSPSSKEKDLLSLSDINSVLSQVLRRFAPCSSIAIGFGICPHYMYINESNTDHNNTPSSDLTFTPTGMTNTSDNDMKYGSNRYKVCNF